MGSNLLFLKISQSSTGKRPTSNFMITHGTRLYVECDVGRDSDISDTL